VTRRKPLQWYGATDVGVGVGGQLPGCDKCCDLLFMPGFAEAVYSVSIEHPGDPADLAKRTIDSYHARRHPAGEWGLS
jgi:hypothetical protein